MTLNSSSIVKMANGHVGLIMSFNNQPTHIMTRAYVRNLSQYDDNGQTKNSNYNIVEVYDGSNITNVNDVFSTKFDITKLTRLF